MWRKTERSDGVMMYLQTVWQRKSVTAGTKAPRHEQSREERKELVFDSGCCVFTF